METSAPTTDSATTGADTSGQPAGEAFKAITTQDELNRVLEPRLQRERAKYADYRDVKAKASRLDEIEQANKSEIDKAMDRVTKAEAEVAKVPAQVAQHLRAHLVDIHQINSDDAELFLTANDPELLLKQVHRLVGRESDRKKHGNFVAREGATTSTVDTDEREAARSLFGRT